MRHGFTQTLWLLAGELQTNACGLSSLQLDLSESLFACQAIHSGAVPLRLIPEINDELVVDEKLGLTEDAERELIRSSLVGDVVT